MVPKARFELARAYTHPPEDRRASYILNVAGGDQATASANLPAAGGFRRLMER